MDPSSAGPLSTDPSDRRDSPRVPMKLRVRPQGGGEFVEYDGDISLGGAFFLASDAREGERYELRFQLPGTEKELSCSGEVLRVRDAGDRRSVHLRFVELPIDQELAIARYIDELLAGTRT